MLLLVWQLVVAGGGVAGLHISTSSPTTQSVRAGDPFNLFCDSDTPWRWCFW